MSNKRLITHRFDTSNLYDSDDEFKARKTEIKDKWLTIVDSFLKQGDFFLVKYWSEPNNLPSTTYGIEELKPFSIKIEKTLDDRIQMICPINEETTNIVTKNIHLYTVSTIPWEHIEIIKENGLAVFSSEDNGASILLHFLNGMDIQATGIDPSEFIKVYKI